MSESQLSKAAAVASASREFDDFDTRRLAAALAAEVAHDRGDRPAPALATQAIPAQAESEAGEPGEREGESKGAGVSCVVLFCCCSFLLFAVLRVCCLCSCCVVQLLRFLLVCLLSVQ